MVPGTTVPVVGTRTREDAPTRSAGVNCRTRRLWLGARDPRTRSCRGANVVDIGEPREIREIRPVTEPVPEQLPVPEPAPDPAPAVPAGS